jgi:sporulation protein YlmC with PRC-barrel domain
LSYLKREEIVGKQVIGADGNGRGSVKDLAFSKDGGVGLVIAQTGGEEIIVPIQKTIAIGEYVLLAPDQPQAMDRPAASGTVAQNAFPQVAPPSATIMCPNCGHPAKVGSKFCTACGRPL